MKKYVQYADGNFSRSVNAQIAETNGLRPLSHLKIGIKLSVYDAEKIGLDASEWHHVGKYATKCNYYDSSEALSAATMFCGRRHFGAKKIKKIIAYQRALKNHAEKLRRIADFNEQFLMWNQIQKRAETAARLYSRPVVASPLQLINLGRALFVFAFSSWSKKHPNALPRDKKYERKRLSCVLERLYAIRIANPRYLLPSPAQGTIKI